MDIRSLKNNFFSTVQKCADKIQKSKNPFETIVGFLIIIFSIFFVLWAGSVGNVSTIDGYKLYAKFSKVGDLKVGADVKINGVKVGNIVSTDLNDETYQVKVGFLIDGKFILPIDSKAEISSDGFIGNKFLKINLGTSEEKLSKGGIINGEDFKSLEEVISDIIFSIKKDN